MEKESKNIKNNNNSKGKTNNKKKNYKKYNGKVSNYKKKKTTSTNKNKNSNNKNKVIKETTSKEKSSVKINNLVKEDKITKNETKVTKEKTDIKIDNLTKEDKVVMTKETTSKITVNIKNKPAILEQEDKEANKIIKEDKIISKEELVTPEQSSTMEDYEVKPTKHEEKIHKKYNKDNRFGLVFLILITILIFSGAIVSYIFCLNLKKDVKKEQIKDEEEVKEKIIESIAVNYSKNVVLNEETILYVLEDGKYKESIVASKDTKLILDDVEIDTTTQYFPVINLSSDTTYYVKCDKVKPNTEEITKNDRYKNYIPFNQNIVTNEKTTIYKNDSEYLILNNGLNTPIYKIDDNKYYISYNDDLYYVLKEEVDDIIDNNNQNTELATNITTITYHFFNEDSDTSCNQIICTSESRLRTHLDYLKNNNYFTLTMSEFEDWIDKKINLPKNSVVITIDDGWMANVGIKVLNEYNMNATIFLITKDYPASTAYGTVEAASHSNNLHRQGDCPNGQGGGIQCLGEDVLLEDLSLSRSKLNNTTYFCYPFYEYNNYAKRILTKAGFTMAFAGSTTSNGVQMHQGGDKLEIPRITFLSDTTVDDLKSVL